MNECMNEWSFQWKINFNPDPNKLAQGVIFTGKSNDIRHPPVIFNDTKVSQSPTQKHLSLSLIIGYDSKNIQQPLEAK